MHPRFTDRPVVRVVFSHCICICCVIFIWRSLTNVICMNVFFRLQVFRVISPSWLVYDLRPVLYSFAIITAVSGMLSIWIRFWIGSDFVWSPLSFWFRSLDYNRVIYALLWCRLDRLSDRPCPIFYNNRILMYCWSKKSNSNHFKYSEVK